MKRILGLDLGVSSIGWALVNEKEEKEEQSSIVKLGVRVIPLTSDEKKDFEKGKSITTNADRTLKRGMRRNLQRYKLRRENLIECLKENNIINNESILCECSNKSTFETYRLRAKAATEEVTLEQFARILLMINKKRGYKSNRKAKSGDEGSLIDGMSIAKVLYDENLTPGQYVYKQLSQGGKYIPEFYRSDLKTEFDKVFDKQSEFYPDILTEETYNSLLEKGNRGTSNFFKEKFNILSADNKGENKKIQAYRWRSNAVSKQLPIEEVVYVLCEINGQLSNSSNYLGAIGDRSKELYFRHQTVGQALMQRLQEDPNASLKNIVYYRQDYLDEFERIWETQKAYHKELTEELKKEIRDIIIFYQRNLKSQKGLVSLCEFEQKKIEIIIDGEKKQKTIGRKVCPKSSPLFQEFKIWQILNNIEVTDYETGKNWFLNIEEKERLFKELNVRDKLKKSEVLKLLYKNHKELDLNYKEVEGNKTLSAIIRVCQEIITATGHEECDLSKLSSEQIYERINKIFSALNFSCNFLDFDSGAETIEKEPMYRLWHLLYSYIGDNSKTGDESLCKKIHEIWNIDEQYAKLFTNIVFADDYSSLSSKAIRNILPHLKDGNKYSNACILAGYRHSKSSLTSEEIENKIYKERLDILPKNSLRNPVVEKILNQMINVINSIFAQYGKPDEIRIELARELKSSAKERENMTKAIDEANKSNDKVRDILQKEFNILHPGKNDILRYKLYEELKINGYHTLYSNTYIPHEQLFSKDFDIEHIIPQSRLFDDSYSNKTLESRAANIEKGNDTAYDYVEKLGKDKLQEYKNRIDTLYKNGHIKKTKRDKLLMKGADIPNDFIDRDLRDTQYIAKKAKEILNEAVPVVTSTTGKITDRLREDWQLIDVMQELNWDKYNKAGETEVIINKEGKELHRIKNWTKRNDHRHHAMDALAIAFTKPGIIQYLNNINAKSNKEGVIYNIERKELVRDSHGKLKFKMPFENFRNEAKKQLDNILVSIKSKSKVVTQNINKSRKGKGDFNHKVQLTPRGKLHNETIYGSIQRYKTTYETVGSNFDYKKIASVANKRERLALLQRLDQYDGDAKKAFTGKNSLEKNPIILDKETNKQLPLKVKIVKKETIYTIRKSIDKSLNVDKVVDSRIKQILKDRLALYGNDASKAFSNLDENPIWLNKEKGIKIKRVTITGITTATEIHTKKDHFGNTILDKEGKEIPTDFVELGNNHHVAIYIDENGKLQEHIVSFYEATERALQGIPVIDKEYKAYDGWQFLFSMKINEYFLFPNSETGFNPKEIDLTDTRNNDIISQNLFRVQKLSSKDYWFRHHLETSIIDNNKLRETTWKRITAIQKLEDVVKVRINHIGEIVHIGE